MSDSMIGFIPLTKIDEKKHQVWGVAAVEQPDRSREIMDYASSKPNFLAWSASVEKASGGLSKGNLRSMHKMIAAGRVIAFEPDDAQKLFRVGVEVVDEDEWQKVLKGVYTGFSVGGSYGLKWPDPNQLGYRRYEAKPNELSLADVPCMPGATFEVIKADGSYEMRKFVGGEQEKDPPAEEKQAPAADGEKEQPAEEKQAGGESATAEEKPTEDKPVPPAEKDEAKTEGEAEPEPEQPSAEDQPPAENTGEQFTGAQLMAIEKYVIELLKKIGLVREQLAQAVDVANLRKRTNDLKAVQGDQTARIQATADAVQTHTDALNKVQTRQDAITEQHAALEKALADRADDLQKRADSWQPALNAVRTDLEKGIGAQINQLAEQTQALEKTLDPRLAALEGLVKGSGFVQPVLRELGLGTIVDQEETVLKAMMTSATDPNVRQALGLELTRRQIMKVQNPKP
jgi:hypothetical protein